MATYDYRVTVKDGARAASYDVSAGHAALAVSRALERHARAYRGSLGARFLVEASRLGVHKRGACGGRCSAPTAYGSDAYGSPSCGAPCVLLDNHVPRHTCEEHYPRSDARADFVNARGE